MANGEESEGRRARALAAARRAAERTGQATRRRGEAALEAASDRELDADTFVDRRRKSRGQRFAEAVTETTMVDAPTGHTLSTTDTTDRVVQMARAPMEPDWEDNPEDLDTPEEVREDLRESGLDPMDTATADEAQFGHFLVHTYADDRDRGGRTVAQLEAEHDMVVASMLEHGVNHHSPLDVGDIHGGDMLGAGGGGDDGLLNIGRIDLGFGGGNG